MKLTVTTFVTLDGVMQSPGGAEEDPSGGFTRGGWLVPYADMDMGRIVTEAWATADATLLGRKTYELMFAYWRDVTDPDNIVAAKLNTYPKYVVSSTLTKPEWADTTIIRGDLASSVAELKNKPGRELQVHGSGRLARALHDLGLIDEYRLWVFPVVLGTGYRLFGDGVVPSGFKLADTKTTSSGISVLSLQPTGAPAAGTVAVDEGKQVTR